MRSPHRTRFGIVSDPHLAPADAAPYIWHNAVDLPHSAELLDAAIAWLRQERVDTIVLLGDLTEGADDASFATVCDRVLAPGLPVTAVPGNCDVDPGDRSLAAFERIAGPNLTTAPAISSSGGDSIELIGVAGERGSNSLRSRRAPGNSAPGKDLRIVFTHYPVLDLEPDLGAAGFNYSGNVLDRAEVEMDLRASGNPTVVVHGHLHVHDVRSSGSILQLSCASLIEPPHHVSVIDVITGPERIVVERRPHAVRASSVEHLPVFAPLAGRWEWTGAAWVAC